MAEAIRFSPMRHKAARLACTCQGLLQGVCHWWARGCEGEVITLLALRRRFQLDGESHEFAPFPFGDDKAAVAALETRHICAILDIFLASFTEDAGMCASSSQARRAYYAPE